MNIVKLHQLIDQWAAEERKAQEAKVAGEIASPEEPSTDPNATPEVAEVVGEQAKLPEGKRLIRTKTSGDVVSLLDEVKKTRHKILGAQGPEIVAALGFTMADVQEIDEADLFKYQMGPAIYKIPDGPA